MQREKKKKKYETNQNTIIIFILNPENKIEERQREKEIIGTLITIVVYYII